MARRAVGALARTCGVGHRSVKQTNGVLAPGVQLLDLQASGIDVAAWGRDDDAHDRLPVLSPARWLSRGAAPTEPSAHMMVAFGGVPLSIGACQLSPAGTAKRDAQWLYLTGVPLANGAPGVAIARRSGTTRHSLTSPELAANFLTAAVFAPTCGVTARLALRWPRPFGIPGLSGRQLRIVREADSFRARITAEDRSLASALAPESPLIGPLVVSARIRELAVPALPAVGHLSGPIDRSMIYQR